MATRSDSTAGNWWQMMPKVELHAHLNGSIRDTTLLELARELGEKGSIVFSDVEQVIMKNDRSLREVFKLFDLIHLITTDHKTVTRITKEVIEDFAAENVVYLELRTTPKVELALRLKRSGVVGIDLSGNPAIGEWKTFLPALKFAKEEGLSVTLHCGEVPNSQEVHAMLDFIPGRIGHACFLEEDHWRKLKSYKIPVEICLTSNIRTESISSVDVHHFADLYESRHPITLCTDDSGVFSTSLSNEFVLAASTFGIGKKEMYELARDAINFIFGGDGVKEKLEEIFASAAVELEISID
ncbi:OLC1v1021954C2 [Oldenlandia corymbosa var. corymbosa]|uniref:OLC1v1021954C2 n=1 Tax=Oldenlandia corymbosa var. corymbosa TaxID=529605 RepID=A0AAV1BWZ6_OLDCO|nr:OLC1v1021954C2 [Oldenlandia corymbosa var. corymbosa]